MPSLKPTTEVLLSYYLVLCQLSLPLKLLHFEAKPVILKLIHGTLCTLHQVLLLLQKCF